MPKTDGGTNLAEFVEGVGAGDDDDPHAAVVLKLQLHLWPQANTSKKENVSDAGRMTIRLLGWVSCSLFLV